MSRGRFSTLIDASLIAYAVKYRALPQIQQAGISLDDFVDEYRTVWKYLLRTNREHDTIPSEDVLLSRFPDLEMPRIRRTDLPVLIHDMRKRRKFMDFLKALNTAASDVNSPEDVDTVLQALQGKLNSITFSGGEGRQHLVDLFDPATSADMLKVLQDRRSGRVTGIPTSLSRFDSMAGGMMKQKMMVIMGRTGIGKSWIDLLFVASAVINGHKVVLYPLEMSIPEVAFRLYSIFTCQMFGADRALKNYELSMGKLNPRKVTRFLTALEDKFKGQLLVADVGAIDDPYTVERIEADLTVHRDVDLGWVDYITLLKPAGTNAGDDGWQGVRQLSSGLASIAKRRNVCMGCSAQVNREALKANVFLPRLEHISFGDSIGHDADQVIPINRRGKYLYYSLVKNRGGPEFGQTKVRFDVNVGNIQEVERDQENNEDSA